MPKNNEGFRPPEPYKPHPSLDAKINSNIADSEIEGGVITTEMQIGEVIKIQTKNTLYSLERRDDGFYLSGNPKICPEPTKVTILGSNWGNMNLKKDFIGRGMYMEFGIEGEQLPYTTSLIKEISPEKATKK